MSEATENGQNENGQTKNRQTENTQGEAQLANLYLQVITNFLDQMGWGYEPMGEQMVLRSRVKGKNGEWLCFIHCRADASQCVFYSSAPVRTPEVLRPAVVEYITRANWGLLAGNFEFDYGDGEVRFKTMVDFSGTSLTNELLHALVKGNVSTMDTYLPGLEAVIGLQQTPADAIRTVEGEA